MVDAAPVTAERPATPPLPESIREIYDKYEGIYTPEKQSKAWADAATMVQEHIDAMIKRWNKEIDTYLVFAALFSAILTAFNVTTYDLLQSTLPDSTSVLHQISTQLGSFSINPPFVNSTYSPKTILHAVDASLVKRWAIWLNGLWFSSLVLSLISASIGILDKQWLNMFSAGTSGNSIYASRVRQYRLNNLIAWRVTAFIGVIPILLLVSLGLFLAGILVLLWQLHRVVATIASVLVALLAAILLVTTTLPLFDNGCMYRSPQVQASDQILRLIVRTCSWTCRLVYGLLTSLIKVSTCQHPRPSGRDVALYPVSSFHKVICSFLKIATVVGLPRLTIRQIQDVVENRTTKTWQERERKKIRETEGDLEIQMLVQAHSNTLHPDALFAAEICLAAHPPKNLVRYFDLLRQSLCEYLGEGAEDWTGPLGRGNQHQFLWIRILLAFCITTTPKDTLFPSSKLVEALHLYVESGSWSLSMKPDEVLWAISALCSIIDHLEDSDGALEQARLPFLKEDLLYNQRRSLLDNAIKRTPPLGNVLVYATQNAYRRVRLSQSHLEEEHDKTEAAYTKYLRSVDRFLSSANRALSHSEFLPTADIAIIIPYTQDVLVELTDVLWKAFSEVPDLRQHINTDRLWSLMQKLRDMSDELVTEGIPDTLIKSFFKMTHAIAVAYKESASTFQEAQIQFWAHDLNQLVARVKNEVDPGDSRDFDAPAAGKDSQVTPGPSAPPNDGHA